MIPKAGAATAILTAIMCTSRAFVPPPLSFRVVPSEFSGRFPPHGYRSLAKSKGDLSMKKKETTLDRIFGPKLFKTVTSTKGIHSVPLIFLRVTTGILMIHHGTEGGFLPANFDSNEFKGFTEFIVDPYLHFLPGPGYIWSAIHDYVEFFGGILFALGLFTRPAALSLLTTMSAAVYFHISSTGFQGAPFGHVPNYSYDFEEPLLYAAIFLLYWFNGCGGLGVDEIIYANISEENNGVASDSSTLS